MKSTSFWVMATGLTALQLAGVSAAPTTGSPSCSVAPLHIDLSAEVPRMFELINHTRLPDEPVYPGVGSSMGIDLEVLRSLKEEWLNDFDWEEEQEEINQYVLFPYSLFFLFFLPFFSSSCLL